MHVVIWTSLLIVATSAAPTGNGYTGNELVRYINNPNTGNGSYYFSYETKDGVQRDERGELKYTKDNIPYISVKGYYSYNDILVIYDADDNGYREYTVKIPSPGEIFTSSPPTETAEKTEEPSIPTFPSTTFRPTTIQFLPPTTFRPPATFIPPAPTTTFIPPTTFRPPTSNRPNTKLSNRIPSALIGSLVGGGIG